MKKLIIVCEEKRRHYGDFLSQLVSLVDDKEEEIVGVKDGIVAAQVWTEKDYTANAAQISSEQYILFIGDSKLIKDKRSHISTEYSKFGMQYGWLGKQAVLFVDKVVDINEYDSFIEYAKGNQLDVTKLIKIKPDVMAVPDNSDEEDAKGVEKLLRQTKHFKESIVNASNRKLNTLTKMANSKKIVEQEYTCLVLAFYLNGLSKFLGLSEE